MAEGRSFADYVKRKCYNSLFSAAEDYICENTDSMNFKISHVHRIGVWNCRMLQLRESIIVEYLHDDMMFF